MNDNIIPFPTPEEQAKLAEEQVQAKLRAEVDKNLAEERLSYLKSVGGEWFAKRACMKYWKTVFTDSGAGRKPTPPSQSGIPYLVLQKYQPKPQDQKRWFNAGVDSRPEEEKKALEDQVLAQQNTEIAEERKRVLQLPTELDRRTASLVPPEVHAKLTSEEKLALYNKACDKKVIIHTAW